MTPPKHLSRWERLFGKIIAATVLLTNHYNIGQDRWYEGVGSESWPYVNHPWEYDGPKGILLVCSVGDEVIYYNSAEENPYVMEARKRFDFTHTIKTQPKAPIKRIGARASSPAYPPRKGKTLYGEYNNLLLGINLDPLDDAYTVRITDETGKDVYEKNINADNIVALNINISAYTAGRYTVTVENSSESFTDQFETVTTGISDTEHLNDNGEMSNQNIYNLQGQRIRSLQKGLNIVNEQKVIVK